MTEIVVTYLCWNCGSLITKLEEIDTSLPMPAIEQWNICPECIDRNKNNSASIKNKHIHPDNIQDA